mmetsp:Transcript_26337/g.85205  ORF Transcript_26337/g.85205 Transcript_26337/m.85205 type:complete len:101 (-) Transcript_26337:233-535(-)
MAAAASSSLPRANPAAAADGKNITPPPPPPEPEAPQSAEDLQKRQKNLKKKLKQAAELRSKVDAGLEPSAEQREKLDRATLLEAELADVDTKLAALETTS